MIVKRGDVVAVVGSFVGEAYRDFDTEVDKEFPINVAEPFTDCMNFSYKVGEAISCMSHHCKVTKR